jgi:formylglycine-generating enzyme required for sulfatase activity
MMAVLPGGPFAMGTPAGTVDGLLARYRVRHRDLFAAEVPQHTVWVDPFEIDVHPVTNQQFRAFLDACPEWRPGRIPDRYHNGRYLEHWQGLTYPPALADHPVVFVGWYAAVAYAAWAGKRLPTEAEWDFAARGGLAEAEFPWGDDPPGPERANFAGTGLDQTSPVCRYPPNGFGLYDMAGNVWEYCLDEWQADFYGRSPRENPVAGAGVTLASGATAAPDLDAIASRRVIRGGSWGGAPINLRVSYRDSHPPDGAGPHVGFRCARPVPAAGRQRTRRRA